MKKEINVRDGLRICILGLNKKGQSLLMKLHQKGMNVCAYDSNPILVNLYEIDGYSVGTLIPDAELYIDCVGMCDDVGGGGEMGPKILTNKGIQTSQAMLGFVVPFPFISVKDEFDKELDLCAEYDDIEVEFKEDFKW